MVVSPWPLVIFFAIATSHPVGFFHVTIPFGVDSSLPPVPRYLPPSQDVFNTIQNCYTLVGAALKVRSRSVVRKKLVCRMRRGFQLRVRFKQTVPLILFFLSLAVCVLTPNVGLAQTLFHQSDSPVILAQIPTKPNRSIHRVFRLGDIEYTNVIFNGESLFQITNQIDVTVESSANGGPRPVVLRAEAIEANLEALLNVANPDTLQVKVSTLDYLTVVVASDPPRVSDDVVVTVTKLDSRLAQNPASSLARDWAEMIQTSLQKAWREKEPEARRRQRNQAIQVGGSMIVATLVMGWARRFFYSRYKKLKQKGKSLAETAAAAISTPSEPADKEKSEILNTTLLLKHRINLHQGVQQLLGLGQFGVCFWGILIILRLFPESRWWSYQLSSVPSQILIVSVVMFLVTKLSQEGLRRTIRRQLEELQLSDKEDPRVLLRAPTIEVVFSGITNVMAILIGLIWLLLWLQIDLGRILTGAGIFGAALGIIFQNLLKDWLNGMFILLEDQYAVGDVVDINGVVGFVERMSFRTTEVRAAEGRLTTIPHNQIGIVHNLTKDWARIDLTVEITLQTNPTEAMAVMKQVAADMQKAPAWQDDILDPTVLIGVSNISAAGTQIMMWIQTKRMRQWDVGREFRRRLKLAFDQQGIEIGMPQQTIRVHSSKQ